MADKKITALPAASSVAATDLIPIVHDPAGAAITQKATVQQVVNIPPTATVIDNIALTPDQPLNALHGLGAIPTRVLVVLKFISATAGGYAVGDEIPYRCLTDNTDPGQFFISWGVNATRVWISIATSIDAWPGAVVITKTGGSTAGVDSTNIVGKVYMWL